MKTSVEVLKRGLIRFESLSKMTIKARKSSWRAKVTRKNSEKREMLGSESPPVYKDDNKLKRKLKDRHLSLIALAGIIGPGILIGASLATENGPASMLISFILIGIVAFCMMQSLGELSTTYPVGGAFSTLGGKIFDPAFGGALGWYYVIVWFAVLANEYNTVAVILQYWGPQVPLYGYILIFWFAFLAFQFLGVAAFGEAEFWLALIKILGLVAFYIFSIVYVSGGIKNRPAFGFHYWNSPGAFNRGFRGLASTFVYSSTFYSGTESVALAASESLNPSRALPKAIRQTFWRILLVYLGVAISYGMTVPYDDGSLTNGSKSLQSPMTIAIKRAGWSGGVHLVNVFILITCVSALNSSLYMGSRTIVNLAIEGSAPRFLGRINKFGVPYAAVIFMNCLGLISLMNISTGAAKAYNYIVNISGVALFIVWGCVCFLHIRFRQSLKIQWKSADVLPYRALLYPYLAILGLVLSIFLALVQGWSYFKPFNAGNFVDAYILLPVFLILYLLLKVINKTKVVPLSEINLDATKVGSESDDPEKVDGPTDLKLLL